MVEFRLYSLFFLNSEDRAFARCVPFPPEGTRFSIYISLWFSIYLTLSLDPYFSPPSQNEVLLPLLFLLSLLFPSPALLHDRGSSALASQDPRPASFPSPSFEVGLFTRSEDLPLFSLGPSLLLASFAPCSRPMFLFSWSRLTPFSPPRPPLQHFAGRPSLPHRRGQPVPP